MPRILNFEYSFEANLLIPIRSRFAERLLPSHFCSFSHTLLSCGVCAFLREEKFARVVIDKLARFEQQYKNDSCIHKTVKSRATRPWVLESDKRQTSFDEHEENTKVSAALTQ